MPTEQECTLCNRQAEKHFDSIDRHIEILNDEHGQTRDKVVELGANLTNVCKKVDATNDFAKEINNRVWWILGSQIIGFLITILLLIIGLYIRR